MFEIDEDDLKKMRQRLGLEENDTSRDEYLKGLPPFERVRIIAGWLLGDERWADNFFVWCNSQGLYLTTNPEADGVLNIEW